MPEVNSDHARAIGEKLRTVRQTRGFSLRDLARRAEISASMLSQIETGKAFPSVRSIYNIASALDVPVDYFFPEQTPNDFHPPAEASEMRLARVGQSQETTAPEIASHIYSTSTVVHPENRPTIELKGGVTWSRLTGTAEQDVEFLEITYEPGASSGTNMSHHAGREFGLVLQGELSLRLGFDLYELRAGDSIIFDSSIPHRLSNKGIYVMRAFWVVMNTT